MSSQMTVCNATDELKQAIKQFRFRKSKDNAALIMKANKDQFSIDIEELMENCSLEDLRDALPDFQPRYVLYSYKYSHSDGRVSYPLCFISICPAGSSPELLMMYSTSMNSLVQECGLTKVFHLQSTEDLTDEWLNEQLAFFR